MQQTLIGSMFKGSKADKIITEEETKPTRTHPLPWVEKYRPNKLEEVSFQESVVRSMEGIVQSGNMPHMIFYGPPGTGKTSTVLAAAKQIFGPNFYKKRILELNASDDRGIPVVREKIKKFAEKAVAKNPDKSYICPVYKVIILDEADLMTTEAQSALRRIIEDNSSTTRFVIICNYITKIIEPLSSRCIKFRFNPISEEAQLKRLQNVCKEEGVIAEEKALRTLIQITEGDLRRSINLLQSASLLYDKKIDNDAILEIAGVVPENALNKIFEKFREGSLDALLKAVDDILLEGFSPEQILNQYFEGIISSKDYSELKIARILEKISECDKALNEGAKDDLQLYNLFASSLSIISKPDFDSQ